MRNFTLIFLLNLAFVGTTLSAVIEGALITQIRGITSRVSIRSSSNPDAEAQPGQNGAYRINVASPARDYILIAPKEEDSNLYSPRVIPASAVGTDTLYIIPPTNPSLTIIVDNKTDQDFDFLIDKCIVLNKLVTTQKDYELTVIPHRSDSQNLLLAAVTPGFPAVVKSVAINPTQRRGILEIELQDIGLQPPQQRPTPAPEPVVEKPQPTPVPVVETQMPSVEPKEEHVKTPTPVYIEKTAPASIEERPTPETIVVQTQPAEKDDSTIKIEAAQSAYYFSDRLVVKDRRNFSIAAVGGYSLYPNLDESTSITGYGVDVFNVKLFKKYFDISLEAQNSNQLAGDYYRGSLTWHHSPYTSIDVAYKSAQDDIWTSQYDVSQTSVGVNGYYKSQGVNFQLGAGVRFQVDVGDYRAYFPEQVEKRYRYLPSFYLLGSGRFGSSSITVLAGMINEAAYASATLFLFRTIGLNYTFKNTNTQNAYFTPYEEEMLHRLSLYINFTLKNREKLIRP